MKTKYPPLKAITIRRLLKLKAAILEEPELYYQWAPINPRNPRNNCQSPGCICGWACALFPKEITRGVSIEYSARRILRLDSGRTQTLFMAWSRSWLDRIEKHKPGTIGHAKVGAAYIDQFIKMNGIM